ncbi:MAG TPA: HAD hydrolase-like protein [Acidobacteriaceae bacterium]|nr:HAD hydrolase-like protein [Acidobacteriaceae bacterium]
MSRPRLLVFDLDGTLIDSSLDLCNSVNAAMTAVDKPTLPNALIASYIGDGAAMLVRRALGDPGDLDSRDPDSRDPDSLEPDARDPSAGAPLFHRAFDLFLAHYREHKLDNTRCYPGVLEALTTIRTRNPDLPMAVLTNKPVNPSREICRALALEPFLFQTYGGNSFASKKPDPEGLLTLISEAAHLAGSSIAPESVVMIGDSDVDILTARRVGARSVGCLFGLAPHTLEAAQPDLTVRHPSEWPTVLSL